jgi:hypothetical protein
MDQRDRPAIVEIEVSPAMVQAGMEELGEHRLLDDMAYVLECVYRAMAYESASACSITEDRKAKLSTAMARADESARG